MRDSWQEKWRIFWLHSIPLLSTVLLMFLFLMPIDYVKWSCFRPNIALICVYYWTIKRGYMFGYFSAFTVGLFADAFSSSPLGVNTLLLMITVAATRWLAHYFQDSAFSVGWFIFSLAALGIMLIKWVILMVYFGELISAYEVMLNYVSTALFYPLIAMFNIWVQKFLPQERINE